MSRTQKTPSNAIFEKTSEPDICNICLQNQQTRLTLDHVPPKSTLPMPQAFVRPLFQKPNRPVYTQGGARYRTLCHACNEGLLGRRYDTALKEMCTQARRLHRNAHLITQQPVVEVAAGEVLRSVLGHLLAAKDHTPRSQADDKMRAFVLDPTSTNLSGLRIQYWAHPDRSIRVIRDFALVTKGMATRCDMLVWYPLGFLVCDSPVLDMPCLDDYLGSRIPVRVPLRALASGVLERWLESTIIITGQAESSAYQASHPRKPEIEW